MTRETIVTPESKLRLQKDYVHDAFGNIAQSTLTDLGTGATRTTTTTYTPDGRFISQTWNALSQTETKTFDPLNGTVLSQTGPNGLTTIWTYDGFGRPLTEARPDGNGTLTRYLRCAPGGGVPPRAAHCVITQSSGSGASTVFFDILDRQIRQDATGFDGRTVSSHTVFNAKGETINTSLPFFSSASVLTAPTSQYTTNSYDAISRVIKQETPQASGESAPRKTTTTYAGLTASITNPKTQKFQTTSDFRGRTVSSTSFATDTSPGDTVTNTHDPYGNLIKVDDGSNHLTSMLFDARGNKMSMIEPNSGQTTYTYNAFGELTSQTDALGRVTTLAYDRLGRMIRRVEPDAPAIYNGTQAAGILVETNWVYETGADGRPNPNGIGKLAYVWRPSDGYFESYRYDSLGRLTETCTQVGSLKFISSTSFDEYSRPDIIRYPNGFAVRNAYNAFGHLTSVSDVPNPSLHYWTALSVNARGQVESEGLGNGLTTNRAYDANTGLLQTIRTGGGSGASFSANVQDLFYKFDIINNLSERKDLRRGITENFEYDTTNQLSKVSCTAADTINIVCNRLGNIVSRSDVGTYSYVGAGPHAVTGITGSNGLPSRILNYNAVGNCVQVGATRLTYNAANQPVSIQAEAGSILFAYTPSRARLKRTDLTDGVLTNRVYIGSLYERDDGPSGIVHTCFVPAGGGVVAIHTQTQNAGTVGTEKTLYVHKDHLGSVQALTDEQGTLVDTLDYDAWGRRCTFDPATGRFSFTAATAKPKTDRGFTGHEMLDAVGLIHMNGRIYDPTIGRFLSVDPVVQEAGNLQNLNRYAYVLNNPLSLTDPSGFSFLRSFGKVFQRALQVAAVAVSVIQPEFAFAYLAAISFGQAFTGTLLAGGSVGDASRAGVIHGGASLLTDGGGGIDGAIANGVVQGGVSAAEGGRFTHGFFSGAFQAAVGGQIGAIRGFDGAGLLRATAGAVEGGTASRLGGGKFANGAVTGAMAHAFGGGDEGESANSSDHPSDISFNDVTHFAGFIVNLPLAIPLWAGAEAASLLGISDFGTDFMMGPNDQLRSGFGTGNHTGLLGGIFGDNSMYTESGTRNEGRIPGLLGISMMIVHAEGVWGNRSIFEGGMIAHNFHTGGAESVPWESAKETFGQGMGILMKHAGFSQGSKSFFGPANGPGFIKGVRSGLTPNLSSYSDDGFNK